jgi:cation transport ATPase
VIEGSALMRVTACGDDSTLGRIISTVQQAQASKPPIQELADRVARYFVPAIALISFVTFTTWILAYAAGGVPRGWYASAGNPYLFAFFFALVRHAVALLELTGVTITRESTRCVPSISRLDMAVCELSVLFRLCG